MFSISSFMSTISGPPPYANRGIVGGGSYTIDPGTSQINNIDYITISTPSYSTDFGDLTVIRVRLAGMSNSSNNRGVFAGGFYNITGAVNTLDYITISILGNALDFGDLPLVNFLVAGTSNGINNRGIIAGGTDSHNYGVTNNIRYISIPTTGNATAFGVLTESRRELSATSNANNNRGVFFGGYDLTYTMDYINISTLGNAADFGDMTIRVFGRASLSNNTNNRGINAGGYDLNTRYNVIDYITITNLGNAVDFGDMSTYNYALAATSNGIGNRGLFEGGNTGSIINSITYITITTPGNTSNFGTLTSTKQYMASFSNS